MYNDKYNKNYVHNRNQIFKVCVMGKNKETFLKNVIVFSNI